MFTINEWSTYTHSWVNVELYPTQIVDPMATLRGLLALVKHFTYLVYLDLNKVDSKSNSRYNISHTHTHRETDSQIKKERKKETYSEKDIKDQ